MGGALSSLFVVEARSSATFLRRYVTMAACEMTERSGVRSQPNNEMLEIG